MLSCSLLNHLCVDPSTFSELNSSLKDEADLFKRSSILSIDLLGQSINSLMLIFAYNDQSNTLEQLKGPSLHFHHVDLLRPWPNLQINEEHLR